MVAAITVGLTKSPASVRPRTMSGSSVGSGLLRTSMI
jgi:hypothetical protein